MAVESGVAFGVVNRYLPFAAAAVGLVAGCASGGNDATDSGLASTYVQACTAVAGAPTALVQVTNTTHTAHSYFVTVAFSSPDGGLNYGTGTNGAGTVDPGQAATVKVTADGSVSGDVVCSVKKVSDL